jgi:hypothetical protein
MRIFEKGGNLTLRDTGTYAECIYSDVCTGLLTGRGLKGRSRQKAACSVTFLTKPGWREKAELFDQDRVED